MPSPHRPDIAVCRKLVPIEKWNMSPLMWPYINLEDLCKTEPLLLMLNSRGRHSPGDFINFDFNSLIPGYQTPYYNIVYLPGYVMSFGEPPSLETYGQLHPDTDSDVRFDQGSNRGVFTADNGIRTLAVQDRLYNFLIKCCEAILHDIPTEDLTQADQHILCSPTVLMLTSNSPRLRFSAIDAFEDLYKRPYKVEFSRIESIVRSMLVAAEDHLLSMRDDPDYFRMVLNQREENCPKRLLDANGQGHPTFLQNKNSYWAGLIRQVFSDAFLIFCVLEATYDSFRYLHSLFKEWKEDPSQTTALPLPICKMLYGLTYSLPLVYRQIIDCSQLLESISGSPALREYYYYEPQDSKDDYSIQIRRRPCVNMTKICTDTMYFLDAITNPRRGILIELELLFQCHPTAKSFVSSWLGAQISILGVLCECIRVLQQYQPRDRGLLQYCKEYPGEIENFYHSNFEVAFNVYSIPGSFWHNMAEIMQNILIGESKYPIHEPRSGEVIEQLYKQFWVKVLDQLQRADVLKECAISVFSLPDEFTHQENSEAEKPTSTAEESANTKMNDSTEESTEEFFESREYPLFKVDSRTFEVFSTLLFDGPDPCNPGEISWDDFVHAMLAMNFTAEKMFGSAWLFEPIINPDNELSCIIFHEPYMGGKLEYTMIKHYGRRIARILKWESDMFIRA
ncbi:hypothetical protein F5Y00DRAFT_223043 [Daldinia vernicosa]|uniref:uncharacterized protein n=1 Tax=Daldinia vernicosa TaxID=114800 RepID=UPI0020082A6A|nr:uncharacterized protein F5Y00DRAFT_223043 [Daldinia vernicosa]KAI0854414.1 hypothetical protein F5Y00DRAFT_223043 [Daldinia vernicosa]